MARWHDGARRRRTVAARRALAAGPSPTWPTKARTPRKDAQRNRDLLLTVAAEQFTAHGVDVPLEDVARAAGVGIGTLYRHFPTRGALIEAVYRREVAQLCDSVDGLLRDVAPIDALAAWMQNFVTYVAAKRGLSAALKDMMSAEPELFTSPAPASATPPAGAGSGRRRGPDPAGRRRGRPDPRDGAICMVTDEAGYQDRAKLMSLLLDGLRAGAPNR